MGTNPKDDKNLDETKRIMERLVKTPPDHKVSMPKKPADEAKNRKPKGSTKPEMKGPAG